MDEKTVEKHLRSSLILESKVELMRANYKKLDGETNPEIKENLKNTIVNDIKEILELAVKEQKSLNEDFKFRLSESADGQNITF